MRHKELLLLLADHFCFILSFRDLHHTRASSVIEEKKNVTGMKPCLPGRKKMALDVTPQKSFTFHENQT